MFSATWVTSSSSKQYLTSGLIASRTFASGPLPSATPRIAISPSVIMPTSLSFSITPTRPASIFFIKAAALRMVSFCLISCTSLLMTLLIFIACPPLLIYSPLLRLRHRPDECRPQHLTDKQTCRDCINRDRISSSLGNNCRRGPYQRLVLNRTAAPSAAAYGQAPATPPRPGLAYRRILLVGPPSRAGSCAAVRNPPAPRCGRR